MESGKNGNTVLMTVIGVATLLVALVGATFAYFSATVDNQAAQSVTITTATPVALQYTGDVNADEPMAIQNALPGAKDTRTFTVFNPSTSSVAQTYDLTLKITENEFTDQKGTSDVEDGSRTHQLLITITASSSVGDKSELQAPTAQTASVDLATGKAQSVSYSYNVTNGTKDDIVICDNQKIEIGETITYTIKLEFLDLEISQNANQGKDFAAWIEISDPRSV